jgi:hypothetical protein
MECGRPQLNVGSCGLVDSDHLNSLRYKNVTTNKKKKREDKLLLIVEPFLYGPKKVIFSKIVDFFII